jgi:hypothetical protein
MVVTAPMMVVAEAEPVVVQLALMTGISYRQEVVVVQDVTEHLQDVVEKVVVHHIDLMYVILTVLNQTIKVKDMAVFHSIIL